MNDYLPLGGLAQGVLTYENAFKTNVINVSIPQASAIQEQIIPTAAQITINHDDQYYFTTTVLDDPGGTMLMAINNYVERTPEVPGKFKILNPDNRPFALSAALLAQAQINGWYKVVNGVAETPQIMEYYKSAGQLFIRFKSTSEVT